MFAEHTSRKNCVAACHCHCRLFIESHFAHTFA